LVKSWLVDARHIMVTQKEKRTNFTYLVNAANIDAAWRNINEVMGKTMIGYDIASVAETAIIDVFEHNKI